MEKELTDVGLSKNESKIYIALSKLGSSTIGTISKESKVHRTNVYDSITGLIKKGLVSYILRDNTKYYEATDPNNLLNIIKEKEDKIKSIMPKLEVLKLTKENSSNAEILEGLPAAKRAMENFLTHEDTIRVLGVPSTVATLIKPFLTNFHRRRIEKKIEMMHIYNTDAHARIKELSKMKYTPIRVLSSKYDSPVATNIVGDEVTMIYWAKDAVVIRIKNKVIANAYKNYFDILWKDAKLINATS